MWAALRRWLTTPDDAPRRATRPSYHRGGGGYRPGAGNASSARPVTDLPKPPPGPGGGSKRPGTGQRLQLTVQADEPEARHQYTSTACYHGTHSRCRGICKFCPAVCRCVCHLDTPP